MPKSKKRKKTIKKNRHARRNPNDGTVYLTPEQIAHNNRFKTPTSDVE